MARSYSSCPGTRADGGDLGEAAAKQNAWNQPRVSPLQVERGQMHSDIEAGPQPAAMPEDPGRVDRSRNIHQAALFDPELELGCPLGPVLCSASQSLREADGSSMKLRFARTPATTSLWRGQRNNS